MKITIGHILLSVLTILTIARGRAFWSDSDKDKALLNGFNSLFTLRPASKVLEGKTSTIRIAALGKVKVLVNGEEIQEVSSTSPKTIDLSLKKNDIVGLKGEKTGKKAGLIATVTWGSTKYLTGEDRFTARTDYDSWDKGEQNGWSSALTYVQKSTGATRTFCHWDRAENMDISNDIFDSKAYFIWRLKSTPGGVNVPADTVYMRLVIGGENCGAPVKVGDEITFHRVPDQSDSEGVVGLSDDDPSEGFCACKLTEERGGHCYDMDDASAVSGRCRPRPCDPKFECVISGAKICLKRRAGTKLVMIAPNQCITVPAGESEMLIPYEG
ncbi:hypothetical protein FGB62_76g081 [Gracilaria domingensis]|nr:hypothetical protein FGB62_76g081 [Gracilaria domingensis]